VTTTAHQHPAPEHLATRLRGVAARAAIRVTEGPHRWGGLDVNPGGRGGWSRTRLVVYPPGTNAAERRRLSAWRAWPVLGAFLAILMLVALASLPQLVSFFGAVAFYVLGFVATGVWTRRLRPRIRTLTTSVVTVGGGITCYGDVRLLHRIANDFVELDDDVAAGRVSPVEYEARWAELYARVPEE
jgi:hypothetical protein